MIIDSHLHAFPDMAGPSGYADAATHLAMQQQRIQGWWGRMVSSTTDRQYMPLPGEHIDFRAGKYGRYYWNKNGKECWLQRFPISLERMEWTPERMVANMDAIGVDVGVLQAGYMQIDYCRQYFQDCKQRYPGRFVSTVAVDYDPRKGDAHLKRELGKLRSAVHELDARGVFQGYPKAGLAIDDEQFDPFWRCFLDLDVPHILLTGFEPAQRYLDGLARLTRVLRKFPDLKIVIGHLGGNVRHPSNPDYTGTPEELLPILRMKNVYFEVGYGLAFENFDVWGPDYEYPYPQHQAIIRRVHDEIGSDRLLWASDMPNNERSCTYRQMLDLVRLHSDFLSNDEKDKVLCRNAARLFGISIPSQREMNEVTA